MIITLNHHPYKNWAWRDRVSANCQNRREDTLEIKIWRSMSRTSRRSRPRKSWNRGRSSPYENRPRSWVDSIEGILKALRKDLMKQVIKILIFLGHDTAAANKFSPEYQVGHSLDQRGPRSHTKLDLAKTVGNRISRSKNSKTCATRWHIVSTPTGRRNCKTITNCLKKPWISSRWSCPKMRINWTRSCR